MPAVLEWHQWCDEDGVVREDTPQWWSWTDEYGVVHKTRPSLTNGYFAVCSLAGPFHFEFVPLRQPATCVWCLTDAVGPRLVRRLVTWAFP